MLKGIFDTHAHMDDSRFNANLDAVMTVSYTHLTLPTTPSV